MHNIYYLGLSGEHRCPLGYLYIFNIISEELNVKFVTSDNYGGNQGIPCLHFSNYIYFRKIE